MKVWEINGHRNALRDTGSYEYERKILDEERKQDLTLDKSSDSLENKKGDSG